MADNFTWIPSRSFTKTSKPRVTTASFSSGYSQRIQYGINNSIDSWDLGFLNNNLTNGNAIIAFFEDKRGCEMFLFTPPGEAIVYKVICQEWKVEYTSHISRTITATFNRVYDIS